MITTAFSAGLSLAIATSRVNVFGGGSGPVPYLPRMLTVMSPSVWVGQVTSDEAVPSTRVSVAGRSPGVLPIVENE